MARVVSNRNHVLMAVLATTSTDTLLYDYSETENFYLYIAGVAYAITPLDASQWFIDNAATATIVYNPFFNPAKMPRPSNVAQPGG